MAESIEQLDGWEDPDHSAHTDDEWHSHDHEAPPQYAHGVISPFWILGAGVGGFIAVVVFILIATVYFKMESQGQIAAKQEVPIDNAYRAQKTLWTSELSGYAWVDPQQGVVQIPLDVAIGKVAEAYAQQ